MEEAKWSIAKVAEAVESEGLGYAVQHYLSYDQIKDKKLSELWKVASEALDKIEDILNS